MPVIPWLPTVFGSRANKVRWSRDFVESAYSRSFASGTLRWRLYYDRGQFQGRYDVPIFRTSLDVRDRGEGDWVGTNASYRFDLPRRVGALTAGGEVNWDLRVAMQQEFVSPRLAAGSRVGDLDRQFAVFLQHEWDLTKRWKAWLGARWDGSGVRGDFLSPRAALLYQRARGTVKLLGGRSFRNPSAMQLYYELPPAVKANRWLRPEVADTFEADWEPNFGRRLNGVVAVYHYRFRRLIESTTLAPGLVQFRNAGERRATGVELELNGRPWPWLETAASVALNKLHACQSSSRSPNRLAKFRLGAPVADGKMHVSGALQYASARQAKSGVPLPPVLLPELTVSSARLRRNWDVAFGVRNLFDREYYDPAGAAPVWD